MKASALCYDGGMSNSSIVGIYHKDCSGNDGQTAAGVLLRKFPEVQLFALTPSYSQEDVQPVLDALTPETTVYTVDASAGVEECLSHGVKQLITIDHHI